jgi:mRNA interferase RelE/StbE
LTYRVEIEKRAQKSLRDLPASSLRRIHESIDDLSRDPRPPGSQKLSGRPGWRIRVGDYRVIYEIRDDVLLVLVIDIGHRREVYR